MNTNQLESIIATHISSIWQLLYTIVGVIAVPIIISVGKKLYDGIQKDRARRRSLYAEAYSTCMEYKEYPYIVYRRGKKDPESERARISSNLTNVQKQMAYHRAWLSTESKAVAKAYGQLHDAVRRIAGNEVKESWRRDPIETDAEMVVGPKINMDALKAYQNAYIKTVHYSMIIFPLRIFSRKPLLIDECD